MIIWINGPFGAGKTTLAKRLRDRRSKSLIFDPEEIGFVVKETVPMPASGDYQDLPLWRGLTIAAVREIRRNYSQDIIIPMTLVHPDYLTEILDGGKADRRSAAAHLSDAQRGPIASPDREPDHAS